MARQVIIVILLILGCGGADAQAVVASGKSTLLWFVVSVRADCSSRTDMNVRITQQPRQGRLTLTRTSGHPNFAASNPRSICNKRRVHGIAVRYHAPRGFTGQDSAGIGATFGSGEYKSQVYSIAVR
jgi:hypothetical protein